MASDKDKFTDGWHQTQIVVPAVFEARLRIGTVPSSNHYQCQYEISDPTTNVLLAMKSWPHMSPARVLQQISGAHGEMMRKLDEVGGLPDPFPSPQ